MRCRDISPGFGVGQESVSRMEKRSDLLLSTLRGYVRAMGGELRLVAEFPGRPPVLIAGLAPMAPGPDEKAGAGSRDAQA